MTDSLDVRVSLSRPAVPATHYLEQPLYALLDLIPQAGTTPAGRPPLNLALVVDASATMHNFQLTDEEREFWLDPGDLAGRDGAGARPTRTRRSTGPARPWRTCRGRSASR